MDAPPLREKSSKQKGHLISQTIHNFFLFPIGIFSVKTERKKCIKIRLSCKVCLLHNLKNVASYNKSYHTKIVMYMVYRWLL